MPKHQLLSSLAITKCLVYTKKPKQPCIPVNIVCFQWYIDWEWLRWWHPSSASRKGWYPILDGSSRVCEWISHIEEHKVFKLRCDEINAIRTGLDSVNLAEFLLINESCILMVFLFTSDISYTTKDVQESFTVADETTLTAHEIQVVEWFLTYTDELAECSE